MNTPILLLHGALGSKTQLKPLQMALARHQDVHVVPFSGHGGLDLPASFSIDLFVKDVIGCMDAARISKANIFGYSMGGYVALRLAHDDPDRVGRIVTLGTKFHWDPESAAREVRMMDPEVIEQKIPHFASTLRERHAPQDWKTVMRLTAEMMTGLGAGKAMKEVDFKAIQHAVLVLRGADDHMVGEPESRQTAGWLRQGQYTEVPGWKHPFESVDIEKLASECRRWYNVAHRELI